MPERTLEPTSPQVAPTRQPIRQKKLDTLQSTAESGVGNTHSERVQTFLWDYSLRRGLRLCSKRQQCKSALCDFCSVRRATESRQRLSGMATPSGVMAVLTLPSAPSMAEGFERLSKVASRFSRSIRGYASARFVEVTVHDHGWNIHLNLVLMTGESVPSGILELLVTAWVRAAAREGITTHKAVQRVEAIRSMRDWCSYASKGLFSEAKNPGSRTPGDLIRDAAERGDADAAALWEEIERFANTGRRRWQQFSNAPKAVAA